MLENYRIAFFQTAHNLGDRSVGKSHGHLSLSRAVLLAAIRNIHKRILRVVIRDRILRHGENAFVLVQQDLRVRGHIRLELTVRIVNGDADFKGGYVVFCNAERSNLCHLALKGAIAEALHFDARRLSEIDVRNVGFVYFAFDVDFGGVALGHDERRRGAEDKDGADSIANLHIAGEDDAVHGCEDGGVAELLFQLLKTCLILQNLCACLLQPCGVHANLCAGCVALVESGKVIAICIVQCLLADDPFLLHLQGSIQCGLVHRQVRSRGVDLILLDVGLIGSNVGLRCRELCALGVHLRSNLFLVQLRQFLTFMDARVDVDEKLLHDTGGLGLYFYLGDGFDGAGCDYGARNVAARHLRETIGVDLGAMGEVREAHRGDQHQDNYRNTDPYPETLVLARCSHWNPPLLAHTQCAERMFPMRGEPAVPGNAMLTGKMHSLLLLQCVSVAMLILANAFFVAAEFALVSVRETRIEQMMAAGIPGARAVRRLQDALEDFLPAVQLGVTLCSLALGWIGEPLAAGLFLDLLGSAPHAHFYAHLAAVSLGFSFITYLHVVVGELVPKSLALRRAEALAVAVAPPMLLFMTAARPAVRVLRYSAAAALRGFDIPMTERGAVHSPEELKLIATAARRMGMLPPFQEKLVHRALELDDVPIREIMTPRPQIFSLPSSMPVEEASARVIEHQLSRVPVYDESRGAEHIVGIVYAKDLARLMFFRPASRRSRPGAEMPGTGVAELRLRQVMRDALVVPETKTVLDLVQEFQRRRRQIAIVVDEYGSTVGLVTAEDALEQLTGELEDEFDDRARPLLATASGTFVLDGGVTLRDLETQMQWTLPRDGGVETLAGFVLMRLGHIPATGESIVFGGRELTVIEMDGLRVGRVRVAPARETGAVQGV